VFKTAMQCVELDFQYPSEGIHRRWDAGFRITACAATPDQSAFVLSVPRRRPMDETQVRIVAVGNICTSLLELHCVIGLHYLASEFGGLLSPAQTGLLSCCPSSAAAQTVLLSCSLVHVCSACHTSICLLGHQRMLLAMLLQSLCLW
jgi:hypothetical protein